MQPSRTERAAFAAALTCIASGAIYASTAGPVVANPGPPRALVLAASLVGGVALATAGRWQRLAAHGSRALALATLSALGGGYLLASVAGSMLGELHAWRAPFFAGIVSGVLVFVSALRALLADQRATQHA